MSDLNHKLLHAMPQAPVGSTWRHKKGGIYKVLGHVLDSSDGEVRVRYQRIGGLGFNARAEAFQEWVRPINEWTIDRFVRLS